MKDVKRMGRDLRQARESLGLTRAQLAENVGASESAIAMYEIGARVPRDEMKFKIAERLDMSIEALFYT